MRARNPSWVGGQVGMIMSTVSVLSGMHVCLQRLWVFRLVWCPHHMKSKCCMESLYSLFFCKHMLWDCLHLDKLLALSRAFVPAKRGSTALKSCCTARHRKQFECSHIFNPGPRPFMSMCMHAGVCRRCSRDIKKMSWMLRYVDCSRRNDRHDFTSMQGSTDVWRHACACCMCDSPGKGSAQWKLSV